MDKNNKKILESKKIIRDEKKKINLIKKNIRREKRNKFKKTKFGKFIFKIGSIFSDDRNNYSFSEVFVITLISLIIGVFACFSVFTIFTGGRNFFKLSKELSKFYDAYATIKDNYYGDVSNEELVDSAISGMVSSVGDIYTSYSDTDTTNKFDELVNGTYEGIGCVIQQIDTEMKIITIYNNSPAEKAGLKIDDKIIKVDDKDTSKMTVTELAEYVKEKAKDKISMTVIRLDEEKVVTLTREKIEIPVVNAKTFESNGKKIGYLQISIFSSVANKQFKENLEKLDKDGIDGLIIDVRDNNGGYLTTVTDITSSLLPKGKIIYQIQKDNKKVATKDKTSAKKEYPIAVLVNGGSASASEILAGAIKESYGGFVVGTKTYGKGTVQQVKKLSDGSMIKYTVENWLTPDGNWINEKGIEPTDVVELDDVYYENPTDENDSQLQKALQLVSE